jgi:hypothetical protein
VSSRTHSSAIRAARRRMQPSGCGNRAPRSRTRARNRGAGQASWAGIGPRATGSQRDALGRVPVSCVRANGCEGVRDGRTGRVSHAPIALVQNDMNRDRTEIVAVRSGRRDRHRRGPTFDGCGSVHPTQMSRAFRRSDQRCRSRGARVGGPLRRSRRNQTI